MNFTNDRLKFQVHMRSLSIACREEVLKKACSDKSKNVYKVVTKELSKLALLFVIRSFQRIIKIILFKIGGFMTACIFRLNNTNFFYYKKVQKAYQYQIDGKHDLNIDMERCKSFSD